MKVIGASALCGIVLLAGCASQDEETDRGRVVIGSGSDQDRRDIDASNQQIFQTERAGIPSASETAPAPSASSPAAPKQKNP